MSTPTSRADTAWPGIRFSFRKHLAPPLIGLAVMGLVYGLLNLQWLQAQANYYLGQLRPAAATAAAGTDHASSVLTIDAIRLRAPIIYEPSASNSAIEYALRSGTVHYGGSALPGQQGNVVIFGHSSGVAWEPGKYKFVFTLLNKVDTGDIINLDYAGSHYTYAVTGTEVIKPTQVEVLASRPGRSELTLITCAPVGSDTSRLIVHATQLFPDPAANATFTPPTGGLNRIPRS